ncbi:transcriptional regulator [Sphaerisporangium sp. NPDC088356]|uniref:transcriptional regulator n=1 Tax=Sphaerisporangium sp. NPDC088356 TaxID=3154871 RepID=UPI003415BB89
MDDVPVWAARLRAERRNRLWTQREMAKQLVDAADGQARARLPGRESLTRMIKDWEAGRHRPKDPYGVLYCRVFAMDEHELFSDGGAAPRRAPADVLKELHRQGDPLSPIANRNGRRVSTETVADLSSQVHSLRLADDVLAGGDLIQPAFRELEAAVRIYREGIHTEDVGQGLLVAIGEFAQIAGWVASDAGQRDQAARTYRLGISAAHEAGDGTLESNLVGSLAYQISNSGDPSEGVELAHTALEVAGPDAPPRARALCWDRVAWAHARNGEAQETMRALGEADDALADDSGRDEPSYLYWVDAGELQIMQARAYTELRRPLRAVPLLTDVLSRYNATHTRELALYLSWLAVALADANEPEEAALAAGRMLSLSADVASDRTAQRARVVLARLKPYRDLPQVRELLINHR